VRQGCQPLVPVIYENPGGPIGSPQLRTNTMSTNPETKHLTFEEAKKLVRPCTSVPTTKEAKKAKKIGCLPSKGSKGWPGWKKFLGSN